MKKQLFKSNTNKMLAGVCGGIGEYLSIDPTLVRLAFALFTCAGGAGLLLYIICACIMPTPKEL